MIDDELLFGHIEGGHKLWLNKEQSGLDLADWLAESADGFMAEWNLPRNSFLGKVHNQWGGSAHFKTLQAYELVGRRWTRERRKNYPNLSLTHFRRIGDDEELAEKANRLNWTVEQIEQEKKPSQDGKLTPKEVKRLLIECDDLRRKIKGNGIPKSQWYARKEEIWTQLLNWARGESDGVGS